MLSLVSADTPISTCRTISSSGNYYLTTNLSTGYICLQVTGANVNIDGRGYTIKNNGMGTYGIYITNTGTTIRNINLEGLAGGYRGINSASYKNGLVIDNVTIFNQQNPIFVWASNNSIVKNSYFYNNSDAVILSGGPKDIYNTTFENNIVESNAISSTKYLFSPSKMYNSTIINNTFNTGTGSVIFISSIYNTLFENNSFNTTTVGKYALFFGSSNNNIFRNNLLKSAYYGFYMGGNADNTIVENMDLTPATYDVYYGVIGSNNFTYINSSYVLAGVTSYADIYRYYLANITLNDTNSCSSYEDINYISKHYDYSSNQVEDYDLDEPDDWTLTGDAFIEYGYCGFWDSSEDFVSPRDVGSCYSNQDFDFQAGDSWRMSYTVDTSSSSVPINVSVCGNNFSYASGLYQVKEEDFTCYNSDGLNMSSPPDPTGLYGMNYAGFSATLSLRKMSQLIDDNKTTQDKNVFLKTLSYHQTGNSYLYYSTYGNQTFQAYNSSYIEDRNITANTNINFNIPLTCILDCWTSYPWGLFIPKGCIYELNKGEVYK